VVFDSEKGINLPPNKRNVGMVFQSYAVWPHMTVFQNVAYSLKLQRLSKAETRERVMEVLTMVGLEKFADRGASLLSGGQMQRVALARSLVMRPSVLMLDEPLSNLDARLRDRLRVELREIQLRLGLTCVYVTHDQHEAFALADRIALLQGGKIVQIGGPREMYETPASASIAHFLGVSNVMDCESVSAADGSASAKLAGHDLTVHSTQGAGAASQQMKVCMRAEDLQISSRPTTAPNAWQGKVMVAGFQGNDIRYAVELEGGLELDALGTIKRGEQHEVGDSVWVTIEPAQVQILPAEVLV
jgi:iron(III) transport system ATP-binding protein